MQKFQQLYRKILTISRNGSMLTVLKIYLLKLDCSNNIINLFNVEVGETDYDIINYNTNQYLWCFFNVGFLL